MNKLISTIMAFILLAAFTNLVFATDQEAMIKLLAVMVGAGAGSLYFYLVYIVEDILLAEPEDEQGGSDGRSEDYRDDNYEDPA